MPINIENIVRNFIIDNFLFEEDGSLTNEMSLIEDGIIDSTGIMELVAFLEDNFGLCVKDEELVPENLSSIQNISVFIKSKRNNEAPILS